MLKRNGKQVASGDEQLSLFDFSRTHEHAHIAIPEPIRTDGTSALAGVSAGDGGSAGGGGTAGGSGLGGAGDDAGRNGTVVAKAGERTEPDAGAGADDGVGIDPGEVHSPAARSDAPLNTRSYRIAAKDQLGSGSQKQKARGNFAAIELVRRLDAEGREATDEEKRLMVRYVGWGGIPQAFANGGSADWQAERDELKRLLSDSEYAAARATTLNAHYTSPVVIAGIYDAVERFGFGGGRVLEPALGSGHFFGIMPDGIAARSRLTGIELDPLTASIARHLYPDADIRAGGFESARLVDSSFDLAISNVPFGDYKLHDPEFNERNFLIHDYFFAKGLKQVRPGGLLVFITSKGTLDKVTSHLRDYLADKADFLGAIRLPNTAFKQNANTEVTTDIVFLRRLVAGEKPTGPAWLKLTTSSRRCVIEQQGFKKADELILLGDERKLGREFPLHRKPRSLVLDSHELLPIGELDELYVSVWIH